ncbi:sulfotransferase [Caulobacter segnis]
MLPISIHELRYEDLIADPEAVIRNLVRYCGLDWDPACLNFQATARTVQTPSRWQWSVGRSIRPPIGRWRRYEAHLTPLMEVLDARG